MLYIYRPQQSSSARLLADALDARRIRRVENLRFRSDDYVVSWGATVAAPTESHVLNRTGLGNKLRDIEQLVAAGVPTVSAALTVPLPDMTALNTAYVAFTDATDHFAQAVLAQAYARIPTTLAAAGECWRAFETLQQQPAIQWLPRVLNHVGGADLIEPPTRADYFVKREQLVREFRVHSFLGRSIRAGVKVPRSGWATVHPWVRSFDSGWMISYDGSTVTQAHRDLAHKACAALGLDFGAVDLAETANGRLIVLEVNRAPGIDAGTIDAYVRAVRAWMNGEVGGEA